MSVCGRVARCVMSVLGAGGSGSWTAATGDEHSAQLRSEIHGSHLPCYQGLKPGHWKGSSSDKTVSRFSELNSLCNFAKISMNGKLWIHWTWPWIPCKMSALCSDSHAEWRGIKTFASKKVICICVTNVHCAKTVHYRVCIAPERGIRISFGAIFDSLHPP